MNDRWQENDHWCRTEGWSMNIDDVAKWKTRVGWSLSKRMFIDDEENDDRWIREC